MRANPNKVSTRSQFGTRNVYIVQRLTRSSFTTPILYKRGVSATRVAAGVLEAGVLEAGADKKRENGWGRSSQVGAGGWRNFSSDVALTLARRPPRIFPHYVGSTRATVGGWGRFLLFLDFVVKSVRYLVSTKGCFFCLVRKGALLDERNGFCFTVL